MATAAAPERSLGVDAEEPPPYTPNANVYRGETTVEYGPNRPHGPVPPRPQPHQQGQTPPHLRPTPTEGSTSQSARALWNQIRQQATVIADQVINEAREARDRQRAQQGYYGGGVPPQRTGGSWSSFPGHYQSPPPLPPRGPPPPQHPALGSMGSRSFEHLPSSQSPPPNNLGRRASSEFARDFYAVGGDVDLISPRNEGPSSANGAHAHGPGKPTTEPVAGHPLLREGQLLVYPRGYECHKCHNIGYKLPDLKPCRKCWPKYGKDFTGPLAYSYSSPGEMNAENFQRPLPPNVNTSNTSRPSVPSVPSVPSRPSAPSAPSSSPFYTPPGRDPVFVPGRSFFSSGYAAPSGSRVYGAGDSRMGGRRCWRCHGSGTVSLFIIDREQCHVCGGLGRTFN